MVSPGVIGKREWRFPDSVKLSFRLLPASLVTFCTSAHQPRVDVYVHVCVCVPMSSGNTQTRQLAAVPTKGSEINRPQPGELLTFPSSTFSRLVPRRDASLLRNLARSPPSPVASSDCGKGLKEGRKSAFSCHRKWGARGWGSTGGRLGFDRARRIKG